MLKENHYPWILPLVRDGYDVSVKEMRPVVVPAGQSAGRGFGVALVPLQPLLDHVVVELLAPQQARVRLACHVPLHGVVVRNYLNIQT